jgi:glycosyltransferase involved in cell wall biosynthesis
MRKKITLITPTKNRNELLIKALKSFIIFVREIEIFVIDDGSSSEQESLNRNFCNTIPDCKYIYFPKAKGAAASRNHGLSVSSADYIWFVDDDDFVPAQAIKDVLELVSTSSFSSQAIFLPMTVMSNDIIIKKIVPSEERNNFAKYRDIGHEVATSAALFSRKLLLQVGGWDASLLTGQDTDLFLRVSQVPGFNCKCLQTESVIQNIGHSKRITRAVIKQEIGKIQFLIKHWRVLSASRILYYILTFIIVAPLLNEPNLYRLRMKLLSR